MRHVRAAGFSAPPPPLSTTPVCDSWAPIQPTHHHTTPLQAATHSSALAVAEAPAGSRTRTTLRPAADGGQPDQPGRRPVGDCASEVDKNYRKMGLRKTYA